MDADEFFAFFEKSLREWLPTLAASKFRPASDFLDISVSGVNDFVIVAMAAASANIRCEIFSSFKERLAERKSLESCTLRLELARHCLDVRLALFLYETFAMAIIKGPLEKGHDREEWKNIKLWEDWLSGANEAQ